MQPKSTVKKLN